MEDYLFFLNHLLPKNKSWKTTEHYQNENKDIILPEPKFEKY